MCFQPDGTAGQKKGKVTHSLPLGADGMNLQQLHLIILQKLIFRRSDRQFAVLPGMVFWRNLITGKHKIVVDLKTKQKWFLFSKYFNVSQRHFFPSSNCIFLNLDLQVHNRNVLSLFFSFYYFKSFSWITQFSKKLLFDTLKISTFQGNNVRAILVFKPSLKQSTYRAFLMHLITL